MRRDEMIRVRRELGLDLAEAGRNAGVTAASQQSRRKTSTADDCEVDEPIDLHFVDFENFDIWRDAS